MESSFLRCVLQDGNHSFIDDTSYIKNLYNPPEVGGESETFEHTDHRSQEYFLSRIRSLKTGFQWTPVPEHLIERFKKSAKISIAMREKTNNNRISTDDSLNSPQGILRKHNATIAFAPPNSLELGLAFEKRGELFLRLGTLELAKNDINSALPLLAGKSTQKLIRLLKRCDIVSNMDASKKKYSGNNLFRLGNRNVGISQLSSSVDVDYHPLCGGRVIAVQAVKPGDTLILDRPFAFHLEHLLDWDFQHCINCSKPTFGGIPCNHCTFGWFCSESCLEEASGVHSFEHNFLACLKSCGIKSTKAILASRIIFTVGPSKLFRIFQGQDPMYCHHKSDHLNQSDFGKNRGLTNSCDTYLPIYNLISHPAKNQAKGKSNAFTAILLTHLMEESTDFFSQYKTCLDFEGFQEFVASLLLRHLESIPYNAITLSDFEMRRYGAGVFPVFSLVNHSCSPNCVPLRNPSTGEMALIASRNIAPGEEVTFSYAPHFSQMETQERRSYLSSNYNFICGCEACDGGLGPKDCKSSSWRIPESQCNGCRWYPLSGQCPKCVRNDEELSRRLEEFEGRVREAVGLIDGGKYDEALDIIKRGLDFCSRSCPPYFPLVLKFEQLFKCVLVEIVKLT